MSIHLRAGERVFVNGAVLRADRKVTLELLNDATFLLESHVILPEQATSPLRQLYFIVQTMLMDPAGAGTNRTPFERSHALLCASFQNEEILVGLASAEKFVEKGRLFEALKTLRQLFPVENEVLHGRQVMPLGDAKMVREERNQEGHEWTSAR